MMQQIAPLQTDIAAKSPSDIPSELDSQWLGNDSQQEPQNSNGAEFGRTLEQQKRATSSSNQDNKTKIQTDGANELGDNTSQIINEEKSASKSEQLTLEQPSPAQRSVTPTNQELVSVSNDKLSNDINSTVIEGVPLDWAALVEEAKSLTLKSAEITLPNVDQEKPVWDGEIAEMIVIDEKPTVIKKSLLEPIHSIELPPVHIDTLTSGEAEPIAKVAESILAALKALPQDKDIDVSDLKVMTSDIDEPSISASALTSAVVNAEINKQPIKVNASEQTLTLDSEPVSLVSSLMVDIVTKLDPQGNSQSVDDKSHTRFNAAIEPSLPLNNDAVNGELEQGTVIKVGQDAGLDKSMPLTTIKLDTSDSNAFKALTTLDSEQQKLVINDIVSRINTFSSETMTGNQQQSFIAALQAGVEEFSKQLKQGREPGLSIKGLIAEAMSNAEINADTVSMQQVSQISSQLSQTLGLTDALRSTLFETPINAVQSARTELGSSELASQTETNKQTQLNQILDKPANITRPEGQNQFAEKIRWIVNARNSFAEIRLDPPDLGSVQVKVSTVGESATVNFVVQSQQARDALEHAAPRLRELLAQQGIELGQSSVQQDNQQQQGQQDGEFTQHQGDDAMEEVASEVIEQRATGGAMGGIDFYA
jgi:flagellar hook-length control protein FliK